MGGPRPGHGNSVPNKEGFVRPWLGRRGNYKTFSTYEIQPVHRDTGHVVQKCWPRKSLRCKLLCKVIIAVIQDSPLFQFRVFRVYRGPGMRTGHYYGGAVISRKPTVRHEGVGYAPPRSASELPEQASRPWDSGDGSTPIRLR